MARYVFDANPDPVALLNELFHGGMRDFKGLVLGDVASHCTGRLLVSYQVLCLFEVARYHQYYKPPVLVEPVRAAFQDKQTSRENPAAHRIPCDFKVTQAGASMRFEDLFRQNFMRIWIQLNVFGRTDRVHRLVNVADRSCEVGAHGMAAMLAEGCGRIANSGESPRAVFKELIVPGYAMAAMNRLTLLNAKMTPAELAEADRKHLVDKDGRPLIPRPTDTRLGSPDKEAQTAARITLRQIFTVYAEARSPADHLIRRAGDAAEGLRYNELVGF